MIEIEELRTDYWSPERRGQVALRIDKDISDLQKKSRYFQIMGLLDLKVLKEIDMDVGRLCQIKEIILSADSNTLEENRERYKIYLRDYAVG
ncbi:hypothetical protein J4423_01535 [Candidatus Pacearchaeota archaeon]|nr:hypothetical protein [Candidatus Pacearchaeota archaeon]